MAKSYTFSHRKWRRIIHLLKIIQTPKKVIVAQLRGIEKSKAKRNISNLGRTQVQRHWIPNTIRHIEQECIKNTGETEVTILLHNNIDHLIRRLKREQRTIKPRIIYPINTKTAS